MPRMNANLAQSRGNPFHFRTQNYRGLMLGYQKGEITEITEKQLKAARNRAKKSG